SIADALTLGTGKLAVDGVVQVCEHGNYPHNEKQQQLYPRYEFFEQIVKVFRQSGRSVPVFSDKHLSYDWKKAKQMYDWSRELKFPLMAGSSLPGTWRGPELEVPLHTPLGENLGGASRASQGYGFLVLVKLHGVIGGRQRGGTR